MLFFLSITITFTEVNTVIPAMILQTGGSELHVGLVSAIMIGVPLIAQLNFSGFLHGKRRKKPFLLLGIYMRVLSLAAIALTMLHVERFTVLQALLIIYAELLLFTMSGAFAGVSYVDLIGKSFSTELRRRFFTRKQLISSSGILVSALLARQGSLHERLPPQLRYPLSRGGGSTADRFRRVLDDTGGPPKRGGEPPAISRPWLPFRGC